MIVSKPFEAILGSRALCMSLASGKYSCLLPLTVARRANGLDAGSEWMVGKTGSNPQTRFVRVRLSTSFYIASDYRKLTHDQKGRRLFFAIQSLSDLEGASAG